MAIHMIVGLGNPGSQYEATRHNVGWWVIDRLAERWRVRLRQHRGGALAGEGRISGQPVLLVKPLTYMNLSGRAVKALVEAHGLPLDRLLVIYDDIDLPPGTIRLRAKGSPGTHNGMRSVVHELASQEIPRLRVGVGGPPPTVPLADYVLSPFPRDELMRVLPAVDKAADAAERWAVEGIEAAMNAFNR